MQVFQGRTLHVQFQVNKEIRQAQVHTLSHAYDCYPESKNSSLYECFIPIACEETPNEYLLAVEITDNVGNRLNLDSKFQVVVYPFKKQTLMVSKEKVQESKELGKSISERENRMQALAEKSTPEKLWRGTFCTPIDVDRISCEFGAIRTTQEKGRYMHKALDLLSAPKSVVWATQAGVIVLKERFEDTGNTVVIDHGQGILSLFCHLDDYAPIEVGQKIALGNPIGTLGKTGYATGYHLHWEMRINNVAIDPMQWTKSTF
jgi:murein DD-endopeptidase MepM/ murein hydrolase activator NlpD